VKVCAEHLAELEQWAIETPGQPISPCGICRPASGAAQPTSTKDRERMSGGRVLPVAEDADDGVVVVADDAGLKMPHPR
jgi:hypothetical protein